MLIKIKRIVRYDGERNPIIVKETVNTRYIERVWPVNGQHDKIYFNYRGSEWEVLENYEDFNRRVGAI